MIFIRENLSNSDYMWNVDSKTNLLSDGPTRKRFDRFSGDCMLHIINLFNYFIEKINIAQAHKIESLILTELPLEAKSEISVLQWLKERHVQILDLEIV